MQVLDKLMANISGITLGFGFFIVGIFVFDDPSVFWLKNLFVFLGLFVIVVFVANAFRQYIKSFDPNFGRVTSISEYDKQSKNASNYGKAKAFDTFIYVFAGMFIAFALLKASWVILLLLLLGYVICEAVALYATTSEYKRMRQKR
ncbi:MAG: hypothetical protein VB078_02775 [Clostridiaceae bacterium]|nr:hypothetical protein [Clostridiaceae bacterium]